MRESMAQNREDYDKGDVRQDQTKTGRQGRTKNRGDKEQVTHNTKKKGKTSEDKEQVTQGRTKEK